MDVAHDSHRKGPSRFGGLEQRRPPGVAAGAARTTWPWKHFKPVAIANMCAPPTGLGWALWPRVTHRPVETRSRAPAYSKSNSTRRIGGSILLTLCRSASGKTCPTLAGSTCV